MTETLANGPLLLAMLGVVAIALIVMAVFLVAIWRKQSDRDKAWSELRETVAGLKSDQRFYLTAKNLGPLHEKINDIGKDAAETRAEMRAMNEQLRVINRHLMER